MADKRKLFIAALLVLAPIFVAWFGLSVAAAAGVVVLLLFVYWVVILSGIAAPERTPEFELATISASHFVEKVRWCMDRLGVDYVESVSGGTLRAFFTGQSVPQLRVRTGIVRSTIGESPHILRYLYGRFLAVDPDRAAFLEPTAARVAFESQLDRYGVNLQVWIYHHLLNDRELTLHAWGAENPATPTWQRLLLRVLFPLLAALIRRSFRITDSNYARAVGRIESLLADIDGRLADGRQSLLGDDDVNYTDLQFAAFTGLWLMPGAYGGGRADAVRVEHARAPVGMRADIKRWQNTYPRAVDFVESLYATRLEARS